MARIEFHCMGGQPHVEAANRYTSPQIADLGGYITIDTMDGLFTLHGVSPATVRELAEQLLDYAEALDVCPPPPLVGSEAHAAAIAAKK